MHTTTKPQLGLLDSLMPSTLANDFLEALDTALDWKQIEQTLQEMYPASAGRPPCAPLVLFKMSLLQHCYALSDSQCEGLVGDQVNLLTGDGSVEPAQVAADGSAFLASNPPRSACSNQHRFSLHQSAKQFFRSESNENGNLTLGVVCAFGFKAA